MGIENIYRHLSGLDLEQEPIGDFVEFVEQLTAMNQPYAIMQKTTGDAVDEEAIARELRYPKPIIGYGGCATFPFISDPDQNVQGVVAIFNRSLIYAPRGVPLHKMRDSFTWSSNPKYYMEGTFLDAVRAFVGKGYPMFQSDNLVDYQLRYRFTIKGQTTLAEIVEPK